MTRTEYCNQIRTAGFQIRPLWQGRTEAISADTTRFDVTCYAVSRRDGVWITNMVLRDFDGGISVYFESQSLRVDDDVALLRNLAGQVAA